MWLLSYHSVIGISIITLFTDNKSTPCYYIMTWFMLHKSWRMLSLHNVTQSTILIILHIKFCNTSQLLNMIIFSFIPQHVCKILNKYQFKHYHSFKYHPMLCYIIIIWTKNDYHQVSKSRLMSLIDWVSVSQKYFPIFWFLFVIALLIQIVSSLHAHKFNFIVSDGK